MAEVLCARCENVGLRYRALRKARAGALLAVLSKVGFERKIPRRDFCISVFTSWRGQRERETATVDRTATRDFRFESVHDYIADEREEARIKIRSQNERTIVLSLSIFLRNVYLKAAKAHAERRRRGVAAVCLCAYATYTFEIQMYSNFK